MADENIGSIAVSIVGDYSGLQGDIDAAAQVAQRGGEEIASALSAGASGADALSGSIATAAAGIETFEGQVQALVDSGSTLAEALAAVSASTEGIASGMETAGAAAETVATEMAGIGDATEAVASATGQARDELGRFTSTAGEAGEAAHQASEGSSELLKTLLEFAGISVSIEALKEFALSAVESAAEVEKAQLSLGFLTGSSEQAAQSIEHLHDVANELALPFDSLVGAEQKMTAFGFSAEQTSEAIQAAADAAAAVGSSFDSAAAAIERMSLSGTAGARQLVALGLSAQDLADVMGVTTEQVAAAFKALDEGTRTDVLVEALQKYQGAAETAADGTAGAIQRLKNAWAQGMEEIGAALSPIVVAVSDWVKNLDYDFAQIIIRAEGLAQSLAHSFLSTKDALTLDFGGAVAEFQAAQKADADTAASLATLKQLHDSTAQSVENHTAKTQAEVQAEVAASLAAKQHAEALGNLVDHYKDFDVGTLDAVNHEEAVADAAEAVGVALGHQQENLQHAQIVLHDVIDAYDAGNASAQEVAKALAAVNTAQEAVNKTFAAMPDMSGALAKLATDTQNAAAAFDKLIPPLTQLEPYVMKDVDILKKMGITMDESGQAVTKIVGLYGQLGTVSHSLDQEDAAWSKISGSVNKLAQTDLPAALKLYDQHLAQIKQLGASEGEILAAESQRLQTEIKIGEQTGTSATAQIVALNNIRLQQQALVDSTRLVGDTIVKVQNDILKGFDSLGKGIADNIIEGRNWGDVFVNIGKQIAKTILEDIVGLAMKELEKALITNTGLLQGFGKSLSGLFGGGASAAGSAASGAAGAASSAAGEAGSAASGAGSAAGGLGGVMGTIGAIGAAVGAISSIVGNFQNARMETTLNAIEKSTRYTEIYTGEQGDGILQTSHAIRDILSTQAVPDLQSLVEAVNGVRDIGADEINAMNNNFAGLMQAFNNIPKLASGTAFVQNDMLAYIHQGEAVVPAGGLQTLQNSLASAQSVVAVGPNAAAAIGVPISLDTFPSGTSFPTGAFPGVPERPPESQFMPYMGGVIPGLPGVPQPSAAPSMPITTTAGSSAGTINANFTILEASNPRETARQMANTLKTLSPRFVVYNQ